MTVVHDKLLETFEVSHAAGGRHGEQGSGLRVVPFGV